MITIRVSRGSEVLHEGSYPDRSAFWLMWLESEGEPGFYGELRPNLRTIMPGVRSWARSWAEKQDAAGFVRALGDTVRRYLIANRHDDAPHPVGDLLSRVTPGAIGEALVRDRSDIIKSVMERCGGTAGRILAAMLLAVIERCRRSAAAAKTVWVFAGDGEGTDISGILAWLFRRR